MTDTHVWTSVGVIFGFLAGITAALLIIDDMRVKPFTALMIGLLIGVSVGFIIK